MEGEDKETKNEKKGEKESEIEVWCGERPLLLPLLLPQPSQAQFDSTRLD